MVGGIPNNHALEARALTAGPLPPLFSPMQSDDTDRSKVNQTSGVVAGGFLWGTLAEEAMQPLDAGHGGDERGGSLQASATASTLAMAAEMPSMSGLSLIHI